MGLTQWGRDFGLAYRIQTFDAMQTRHDTEYTLRVLLNALRYRLGCDWRPVEIHFEHVRVGSFDAYRRAFGAPVCFEQPINQMLIRESDLVRPAPLANPDFMDLLTRYLDTLQDDMCVRRGLSGRVSLLVAQRLSAGRCDLDSVAESLNLSRRALQRQLAAEGTRFQTIKRGERQRATLNAMRLRPMTVADVAGIAGYADRTTLSRAFKSWVGVSPQNYLRDAAQPSVIGDTRLPKSKRR